MADWSNFVSITMGNDQQQFATAIRLGVLGYVLHEASSVEVVTATGAVAQGQAVCPCQHARVLVDYFASQGAVRASSRTRRQVSPTRRVQPLPPQIERRMTGKEIATKLFLPEQTVKNSVHRIFDKVGVGDCLGVIEAYQPRRWVCRFAENTVTKKMSASCVSGHCRVARRV
jgi:DNA-binding NarL/FixJ family response regulator